jgi:hypothetical protein
MTMNRRWALALAVAGGAALGAALTMRRRAGRRHIEKRQHVHHLQAWEGEGGSLATPAEPQSRS